VRTLEAAVAEIPILADLRSEEPALICGYLPVRPPALDDISRAA
jgi:hypothetical protein